MSHAAELIRAIGSLWPLVLIGVAVWFRQPIGRLGMKLAQQLRSLKAGPFELVFWRQANDIRAALDEQSTRPPAPLAPAPHQPDQPADDAARGQSAIRDALVNSLSFRLSDMAGITPVTAIETAYGELLDALRTRIIQASRSNMGVLPSATPALVQRALDSGLIAPKRRFRSQWPGDVA